MDPLSYSFVAAAFASCFAEQFLHEPFGVAGTMLLAVFAVLLPELLQGFVVLPRFKPEVTITADPLQPDAKTVAGGIKEAMRHCLSIQRPVSVLVSRVPGYVVEIALNAVRERCFVEVFCETDSLSVSKSQAALPSFASGLEQAYFQLTGSGENLRLILMSNKLGGDSIRYVAPRVSTYALLIFGGILFLAALFLAGVLTACIAVLPFLLLRLCVGFRKGPRAAFPITEASPEKKTFILTTASSAVILLNLWRFGML